MKKFSIIVPYKRDQGQRDKNLAYVQERYERIAPELELCMSEDGSEPFCKAKAVNQAAKKATGDVFIIVDSDVIIGSELIQKIILYEHVYSWLQPFKLCRNLNQDASNRILDQGFTQDISVNSQDYENVYISQAGPLMNVMSRAFFEKVGGFDERYKGYGWEDISFALALDTICGQHFTMDEVIYHLWHPSSADFDSPQYKENEKLYYRYYLASQKGRPQLEKILDER